MREVGFMPGSIRYIGIFRCFSAIPAITGLKGRHNIAQGQRSATLG